jgi:hypothetical protein
MLGQNSEPEKGVSIEAAAKFDFDAAVQHKACVRRSGPFQTKSRLSMRAFALLSLLNALFAARTPKK